MPNKHITQFLDYYIDLPNPQYAVLLKGKWGSGKTHFINEYKNFLDVSKKKYIYVSLYGVTSYDQIETKFLEKIHPRLYNKKTIFAGKIAKQLLKGALKIDIDDDGKADGNLNVQMPDLKPEDLLNTKDYILIFDDLERCSINIVDLLGYINHFVEHQSYNVILIANEEELDNSEKYKNIKEKLIGKTFEIKLNLDLAYDSFIKEYQESGEFYKILLEHKTIILNIFNTFNESNLRKLKQVILDFKRFSTVIPNAVNLNLIEQFFSLGFQYRIEHKLNFEMAKNYVLSNKVWTEIFEQSYIDKEKIDKEIMNILTPEENKLLELADIWNIKDVEELEKKISKLKESFNSIEKLEDILFFISILYYINEIDILALPKDFIESKSKDLINNFSSEILDFYLTNQSYRGYSYFESNTYEAFFDDLKSKCDTKTNNELLAKMKEIFKSKNKDEFEVWLNDIFRLNTFSFNEIDLDIFIELLLEIDINIFQRLLRNKYLKFKENIKKYKDDFSFIERLDEHLKSASFDKLKKAKIKSFLEPTIEGILHKFNKVLSVKTSLTSK